MVSRERNPSLDLSAWVGVLEPGAQWREDDERRVEILEKGSGVASSEDMHHVGDGGVFYRELISEHGHPRGSHVREQRYPAAQHPSRRPEQLAEYVHDRLAEVYPRGAGARVLAGRLVLCRGRPAEARSVQPQHAVLLQAQPRRGRVCRVRRARSWGTSI